MEDQGSLLLSLVGPGGQFVDIDNDRDLDIHVLSGYFTAPRSFESDIDL